MAKKERKTTSPISREEKKFQIRKVLYKTQSMDLDIDKKKTKLRFRKFVYLIISISSCLSLWNYINNIPAPAGIMYSIPASAFLTIDFPKILSMFKKTPP
ncbi:MAG: hypothetical protein HY062_16025 [Bacteroidetes bacterium]|nr:hypothetical protein [Bacteroidota bacterium]